MSCGHPCAERAVWNSKFCVVTDYQMLLLDKEEVLYTMTQKEPFLMFPTCPYCFSYFFSSGDLIKWIVLNIGVKRVQLGH